MAQDGDGKRKPERTGSGDKITERGNNRHGADRKKKKKKRYRIETKEKNNKREKTKKMQSGVDRGIDGRGLMK